MGTNFAGRVGLRFRKLGFRWYRAYRRENFTGPFLDLRTEKPAPEDIQEYIQRSLSLDPQAVTTEKQVNEFIEKEDDNMNDNE